MYNIMHLSIHITYFGHLTASLPPQSCLNTSMIPWAVASPHPSPSGLGFCAAFLFFSTDNFRQVQGQGQVRSSKFPVALSKNHSWARRFAALLFRHRPVTCATPGGGSPRGEESATS